MTRLTVLLIALALGGCGAHASAEQRARVRLLRLGDELDRGEVGAGRGRGERSRQLAPELHALATRLRTAAKGHLQVRAEVTLHGPLGSEARLTADPDGWRVEPESISLPSASPRAAVEQLIVALDRLESDPALAMLTSTLHASLLQASRERADGLRALLPRVTSATDGMLPLHFDYGAGLFVLLRPESGQWRIDDFN